jgi:F0F1-type ATP synthase assembly protein I
VTGPPQGDAQERQRDARRQGIAYQGAVEAFVAILIAMGAGYWADQRFGTSPYLLLIGLGIGFGAFVQRLVRLNRQLKQLAPGPPPPPDRDPR